MSGWVIIGEENEVTVLSGKAVVIKETVVLERVLLGIDTVIDGTRSPTRFPRNTSMSRKPIQTDHTNLVAAR
jgi:hypothetical protein